MVNLIFLMMYVIYLKLTKENEKYQISQRLTDTILYQVINSSIT